MRWIAPRQALHPREPYHLQAQLCQHQDEPRSRGGVDENYFYPCYSNLSLYKSILSTSSTIMQNLAYKRHVKLGNALDLFIKRCLSRGESYKA